MSNPIRVLIADDHPIVREGLEAVLSLQPDIEVLDQAHDGIEAVQKSLELCPDVVIIDLKMPQKDGLAAITEICAAQPQARILVLTSFADDDGVFAAIKAGALGFVLKDSPTEQLLHAIRAVHRGESVLHPVIARKVLQELKRPPNPQPAMEPLTPREVEVLQWLAQGLSNREIAAQLDIAPRTVSTHVRNILEKLQLANRTQAALYAREVGFKPAE
ncbi:MAG: response regulator transcription factor [Chloroflexales bacterium]|nr:response regulator transcription factor [Chloroflexales bacterium]